MSEKNHNWLKEFETIIEEMRLNFMANKINPFLNAHQKISKLLTDKIQWELNNKTHLVYEHVINPDVEKKLDELNKKYDLLLSKQDISDDLIIMENNESVEIDINKLDKLI